MRKIIFSLLITAIVLISSCTKDNSTTIVPNAWTFKGTIYSPVACVYQKFVDTPQFVGNVGLAAPTQTNDSFSNYAFMSVIFPDSNGVAAGTYTVIGDDGIHPPGANQAIVHLRIGPHSNEVLYYSAGGSNQKLFVSVLSTGTIAVNGNDVLMKNHAAPSDTASIKFTLTSQ